MTPDNGGVRHNYGTAVTQAQIERAAPRFWAKVDRDIDVRACWLWTGAATNRGPAPPDVVHHTCETPLCVNPAHLRHVTKSEHQQHHIGLSPSRGVTVVVTLDAEVMGLCADLMGRYGGNRSATVRAAIRALAEAVA